MSTKEEPQRKLSTRENVIIHICAAWSRTGGIPGFYVRGAPAASKSFHAIERYDVVHGHYLAFVEAFYTCVMVCFGTLFTVFKGVHINAGWQPLKFVSLKLCLVCFKISHFAFKHEYLLLNGSLLKLREARGLEASQDVCVEIPNFIPVFEDALHLKYFLGRIACGLQGRGDRVYQDGHENNLPMAGARLDVNRERDKTLKSAISAPPCIGG
jgi:hypothetical protein